MQNHLVSIIIPTYNRAHIIGETLESVLAQTYQNWECIVVDDGSTDATNELLEFYCEKDSRISYYHRPKDRPKGANACRNFGFEMSKGEYINWFDSDDLMTNDHVISLYRFLIENPQIDFAIGNSLNFEKDEIIGRPYNLDYSIPITAQNFIQEKIGWITNDVLVRKNAILITFNEQLSSGQEYNFFSRLLLQDTMGSYIFKDISLRRIHKSSIQGQLNKNFGENYFTLFKNEFYLLNDIKEKASQDIINRSLRRLIRYSYYLASSFKINKVQKITLKCLSHHNRKVCSILYFTWIYSNKIFGKGYFLINLTTKRLQ